MCHRPYLFTCVTQESVHITWSLHPFIPVPETPPVTSLALTTSSMSPQEQNTPPVIHKFDHLTCVMPGPEHATCVSSGPHHTTFVIPGFNFFKLSPQDPITSPVSSRVILGISTSHMSSEELNVSYKPSSILNTLSVLPQSLISSHVTPGPDHVACATSMPNRFICVIPGPEQSPCVSPGPNYEYIYYMCHSRNLTTSLVNRGPDHLILSSQDLNTLLVAPKDLPILPVSHHGLTTSSVTLRHDHFTLELEKYYLCRRRTYCSHDTSEAECFTYIITRSDFMSQCSCFLYLADLHNHLSHLGITQPGV